ncbi:hypothetical protein [Ideonella sp. B508-1]|uniref:hypothetical protein n=1 Tax=Ideonella sp. B508-1 TaxID=137716 RepID=UPI0003495B2C|nr:hypothetical protein [Ideonella sp. B508-1]
MQAASEKAFDKAPEAASTPASFKDIFAVRSWQPPPPKVEPAPPPPPTAPPLPFSFLGKKQQDGHWEVYLGTGSGFVVARQGEKLLDTYQVLRIEPPRLTLRYLPLQQEQSLDIGE